MVAMGVALQHTSQQIPSDRLKEVLLKTVKYT